MAMVMAYGYVSGVWYGYAYGLGNGYGLLLWLKDYGVGVRGYWLGAMA